jgi:hypothetical protein
VRARAADLRAAGRDAVCVSGRTGGGVGELLALVSARLAAAMATLRVLLSYSAGDLLEEAHRAGSVSEAEYTDAGVLLAAILPPYLAGRLQEAALEAEGRKSLSSGDAGVTATPNRGCSGVLGYSPNSHRFHDSCCFN